MTRAGTVEHPAADEIDTRVIPEAVLALVDAYAPEGHPLRDGALRDIARFYATGGWTPARCARVASIIREAETRLAVA